MNHTLIRRASPFVLTWLLCSPVATVFGHGGEDHGEAPSAAPPTPNSIVSLSDTSDTLELVAQHDGLIPGRPSTIKFYLSDYRTNRPISGASISLDLSGPGSLKVSAKPSQGPGEYLADIVWPQEGEYVAAVTVEQRDGLDLLSLNTFKVGEKYYRGDETGSPSRFAVGLKVAVAGLAASLLGAVAFLLFHKRRRLSQAAALLLAACVLPTGARQALGHGGEDHGDATPAAATARALGDALIIPKAAQFLLGIETDLAQKRSLAPVVRLVGRIQSAPGGEARVLAPYDAVLHHPEGGPLLPGARVRAGQTLALLTPSFDLKDQLEFTSRKREAEAAYRKAESALRLAQANWERARQLQRVLSERERQEIEATYSSAQAEHEAAGKVYEALASLEERKERVAIVSPIEGVVAEIPSSTGNVFQKDAELFRIINPKKLWVHGEAYENQLEALSHAAEGWAEVPVLARRYKVKMVSRGVAVDPATRTIHSYFAVTEPDDLLVPQLTATLYVRTGAPEETLAVPKTAVMEVEGKRVVFVHTSPEEFRAREVELGWADEMAVEVVRGLREGERVVVKGNYELRSAAAGGRR